jgi:hypothetical protein
VIVTAHQPNFLPGLNVTEKIRSADAVIWLDEVQYSHGGWTNRNRMPDGSWLTVPVDRSTDMAPINRVRIRDHGAWRRKLCFALDQHYGDRAHPYIAQIARPYGLLIGRGIAVAYYRHVGPTACSIVRPYTYLLDRGVYA